MTEKVCRLCSLEYCLCDDDKADSAIFHKNPRQAIPLRIPRIAELDEYQVVKGFHNEDRVMYITLFYLYIVTLFTW